MLMESDAGLYADQVETFGASTGDAWPRTARTGATQAAALQVRRPTSLQVRWPVQVAPRLQGSQQASPALGEPQLVLPGLQVPQLNFGKRPPLNLVRAPQLVLLGLQEPQLSLGKRPQHVLPELQAALDLMRALQLVPPGLQAPHLIPPNLVTASPAGTQ